LSEALNAKSAHSRPLKIQPMIRVTRSEIGMASRFPKDRWIARFTIGKIAGLEANVFVLGLTPLTW
jgi:hypothetical protein